MNYNILIVEDNLAVCNGIKEALVNDYFNVLTAHKGKDALSILSNTHVDLVLLDLILPDIGGEDILREFRKRSNVPVIIISMKASDVEKAINFGLGADDYLSKPFSMLELISRIKAVLRRSKSTESYEEKHIYQFGEIVINLNNFTVKKEDKHLTLTNKEFEILKTMILNPNKVYSKSELYRLVWHEDNPKNENIINVHVKRLRGKIEDDPRRPKYITTLWGFGYRLGKEVKKINN